MVLLLLRLFIKMQKWRNIQVILVIFLIFHQHFYFKWKHLELSALSDCTCIILCTLEEVRRFGFRLFFRSFIILFLNDKTIPENIISSFIGFSLSFYVRLNAQMNLLLIFLVVVIVRVNCLAFLYFLPCYRAYL